MSHYTTEVRFICEQFSGLEESKGYNSVEQIIANARDKIFDFDYPLFDDSYRSVIETKILKHYYTREIGLETVGLWKLKLNTKLNEIMPYYNQLYKSALLEFNPLYDVDLTTIHSGEDAGSKVGNTAFESTKKTDTVENIDKNRDYNETNLQSGGYNTGVENVGEFDTDVVNNGGFNTDVDNNGGFETDVDYNDVFNGDSALSGAKNSETTNTGNYSNVGTHNEEKVNVHNENEWNLFSDTPQGGVTGIENAYDGVANNAYLTDARNIKSDGGYTDNIDGGDTLTNQHEDDTDVVDSYSETNNTQNTTDANTNTTNTHNDTTNTTNTHNDTTNTSNTHNDTTVTNNTHNDRNDRTGGDNETVDRTNTVNDVVDNNEDRTENFYNTREWSEKVFGKRGSLTYSKMLLEFRETFMNIDMMVVDELKDLFFLLW